VHPFHVRFPRRSHAGVVITAHASRVPPRRVVFPVAVRAVALGVLAVVAVGAASAAAWLLAGGGVPTVPATLPVSGMHSSDAVGPVVGRAELRADSWPADAQVLVDGRAVGTTPLATEVPPGPHRLTLRRNGDLEATRELDVPAAGAALLPARGRVGRRRCLELMAGHGQIVALRRRPA
jgi:hypothetical protein